MEHNHALKNNKVDGVNGRGVDGSKAMKHYNECPSPNSSDINTILAQFTVLRNPEAWTLRLSFSLYILSFCFLL